MRPNRSPDPLRPLAPLICSEILSHPEAVRDLFEPLMMLTPYDDLHGCDSWVNSVAAPFGLAGVVVWGILKVGQQFGRRGDHADAVRRYSGRRTA